MGAGWGLRSSGPPPLPCSRARQNSGKVRHKRQALQDMARPLKQWLYKHRDNPYPTKTEKILLALGSQMTLVQVISSPKSPHVSKSTQIEIFFIPVPAVISGLPSRPGQICS